MGSFVWFSEHGRPAVGRVVHVDPTVARPIGVVRYRTKGRAKHLSRSCFEEVPKDETGELSMAHITLHQIRMTVSSMTKGGRLRSSGQKRLEKLLYS